MERQVFNVEEKKMKNGNGQWTKRKITDEYLVKESIHNILSTKFKLITFSEQEEEAGKRWMPIAENLLVFRYRIRQLYFSISVYYPTFNMSTFYSYISVLHIASCIHSFPPLSKY